MLKNLTVLEHKIGENVYQMICNPNSPISEIKDVLFQFMKYIGQIEDQTLHQQRVQQEQKKQQEQQEQQDKEAFEKHREDSTDEVPS
jgi:hypothetical protein